MKETRVINRFSEKNLILANGFFMAQEVAHRHNTGSALRIFKIFFTMKGVSR